MTIDRIRNIINECCHRYFIGENLSIIRNDSSDFVLTTEWMSRMYDKFNAEIFGGVLPPCIMSIGPCKLGSRVLGEFSLEKGYNVMRIYAKRDNRRICVDLRNGYNIETIMINKDNIYQLCRPTITLSNLYRFNEYGAILVLLHEMCHYRVEYNGFYPKQSHGPEFRNICSYVSYMTNDTVSISRLLNAESVGIEQSDELKQKIARRDELKQKRLNYTLVIINNGEKIELLNISGNNLINEIITYNTRKNNYFHIYKIIDEDIINELYNNGYSSFMRTYKFWDVLRSNKLSKIFNNVLNDINNTNKYKMIY